MSDPKDEKEKSERYCDYLATYCDVSQGKMPTVMGTMKERNLAARALAAIHWRDGEQPKTRKELLSMIEVMCPVSAPEGCHDVKQVEVLSPELRALLPDCPPGERSS